MDPGRALRVCLQGFREAQMQKVEPGLLAELEDVGERLENVAEREWDDELQRFLYGERPDARGAVERARQRTWRHQVLAIVAGTAARLAGEPGVCPVVPHIPIVPRGVELQVLDDWRKEVRDLLVERPQALQQARPEVEVVAACPSLHAWTEREVALVMARCYSLYVLWWSKAWHFVDLALQPRRSATENGASGAA